METCINSSYLLNKWSSFLFFSLGSPLTTEPLAHTVECHGPNPASWVLEDLVYYCVDVWSQKKKVGLCEPCLHSMYTLFFSLSHTHTRCTSIFLSAEKGTSWLACSNLRQTLSRDHLEIISPAEPAKVQSRSYVYNSVITTGRLELHGWTSHAPLPVHNIS